MIYMIPQPSLQLHWVHICAFECDFPTGTGCIVIHFSVFMPCLRRIIINFAIFDLSLGGINNLSFVIFQLNHQMLVDKVLPSSSAKYFVLSPAHILTYTDKMEKMEDRNVLRIQILSLSVCACQCADISRAQIVLKYSLIKLLMQLQTPVLICQT